MYVLQQRIVLTKLGKQNTSEYRFGVSSNKIRITGALIVGKTRAYPQMLFCVDLLIPMAWVYFNESNF